MPTIERTNEVTMKGDPLTLLGTPISQGDKTPDFELTAVDMSTKTLADYADKVKIISVVPSLDTSVCDTQTRKFNEAAASLGEDVVVLTVSMDLPMAAKRWCGAAGVDRVETLSDYKDHQFGLAYGLRIRELGLLARAVLVVDQDNVIKYMELVPEVASEPNYDAALDAARSLL